MANILEALDRLCITKLDERGRIYIPKTLRERLQIRLGDKIYIKIENDHFTVYTVRGMKKRFMQI